MYNCGKVVVKPVYLLCISRLCFNQAMFKQILFGLTMFILGAVTMYAFLWYQVLNQAAATWCQVYTGKFSVEQAETCKKLTNQEYPSDDGRH